MTTRFAAMQPVRFDADVLQNVKIKSDPAFREMTEGLSAKISEILRDPSGLTISCCFEGCCVSWCCIQLT
jgi:hypothetical protein